MPIVVQDEEVLIEVEDAKFRFSPMTLEEVFGLSGFTPEGLVDRDAVIKNTLDLFPAKLKSWENIVDKDGKPLECTPENFKRLPAAVGMKVIRLYQAACGLTEDFEKNLVKP